MRKSFHGLTALTESVLKQDPLSGHLFVFINRRRDRIKLLYWENGGYIIHYKLLERGTFSCPCGETSGALVIESTDLMMMLQGVDVRQARRRRWWSPPSLERV